MNAWVAFQEMHLTNKLLKCMPNFSAVVCVM